MKKQASKNRKKSTTPDLATLYPDLTAGGWEYRGCGERPQVEELADFYAELGLETKLMPVRKEAIPPDCLGCSKGRGDVRRYRMLFTRENASGAPPLPPA